MGYPGASLVQKSLRARRVAVVLIAVMVIIIATPLGLTSVQIAHDNLAESRAAQATKVWIDGTDYRYVSAEAKEGTMRIVVVGSGALPAEEALRDSLAGRLYGMDVQMEILPSESLEFDTDSGTG